MLICLLVQVQFMFKLIGFSLSATFLLKDRFLVLYSCFVHVHAHLLLVNSFILGVFY